MINGNDQAEGKPKIIFKKKKLDNPIENKDDEERWKVMIVDDEETVHNITKLVLRDFVFEGKGLEFISAYSSEEAKSLIQEHLDVAVILLDVVMEDEEAGLRLVKYVRKDLKNRIVRIILRTGQPGQAPEEKVIVDYDINDYKEKTELTSKKLFTVMISALRSYRDIYIIDTNRKGLDKIIESSSTIFKLQSMREFASGVLSQLTSLLYLDNDALYCQVSNGFMRGTNTKDELYIMAATGEYYNLADKKVYDIVGENIYKDFIRALREKVSIYLDNYSIVYFKSKMGSESLIYLKGLKNLNTNAKELIYKFCTNISIAFDNIYLNKEIIENLRESIVIVDNQNKIVLSNNVFTDTFLTDIRCKNFDNISVVIEKLFSCIESSEYSQRVINAIKYGTKVHIKGELYFCKPINKCYYANVQPVFNNNGEVLGRVISFSDISEYKHLLNELNQKNLELASVNEQLKEHASMVEELAIAKERNRFARDTHDTLGHTMTLLISLMEVSFIACKDNLAKTEEKLSEAILFAKEGLKDLRRSIAGLIPKNLEVNNLINALDGLISDFRSSSIDIDFFVEGVADYRSPIYSEAIYRICQEALTNSLRHGKAKHVTIILRLTGGLIKLFIFDNGFGCKEITPGLGLLGMQYRIKDLNGTISFGSDGESGFNINVEIPLGEEVKK